jgi:acyl-CoA thioesterase FadM
MAVYTIWAVDGFPFVYREDVRFRDVDGMGHVNNAVFLTSVLVGFDYTRGESVEIPADWRDWLEPAEVAV